MSTFSKNPFSALVPDDEVETDKLGNVKPKKVDKEEPRTRREVLKTKQAGRRPVSPPSRRGRDRDESGSTNRGSELSNKPFGDDAPRPNRGAGGAGRGRQFDRHSGTGLVDNDKKINQGWGHAETAQEESAFDSMSPNDPAAADASKPGSGAATPAEPDVKTLDEYLASQSKVSDKFRLPEARKANEGVDDSQWKDAVPFERKDDDAYFDVSKESSAKQKGKNKKERVFIEIDQPRHRPERGGRRGGGGGGERRGRGGGRGGRGGRGPRQANVNISDASAFPTLGA